MSETRVLSLLKKSADLGHTEAPYRIGTYLYSGRGCGKDEREGGRYLRLSADGGNSFGQWRFGACFLYGGRVAKDEVHGFECPKRSLAAGTLPDSATLVCVSTPASGQRKLSGAFESSRRSMEQGNSFGETTTVAVWSMELGMSQMRPRALPLSSGLQIKAFLSLSTAMLPMLKMGKALFRTVRRLRSIISG